ncbi:MAG: capsule assembly Wzi family protein [bacterium]
MRRIETAAGLLPLFSRTEPLTRGEVRAAIDAAAAAVPSERESAWIAGLRRELDEELAGERGSSPNASLVTARASLRSRFEADKGGRSRLRESARVEFAVDLTPNISLFESIQFDTHGERDSDFLGRRWRDSVSGRVDRGGVLVRARRVSAFVGRSASRWGVGEPGGLLLSPASPPLDLVRVSADLGPARLTSLFARLDAKNAPVPGEPTADEIGQAPENRHFAAHRLAFRFAPSIDIGLGESVVFGGESRGFELFYLNPLTSYYAEQWNHVDQDNVLWSADFFWRPSPIGAVNGEILVDDFQFDFKTEPHQVGWTVGAECARLPGLHSAIATIEYTRIGTFVYGHSIARNRYENEGVGLGHPLGPDADRISGAVTWDASENATLSVTLARERRGAQRIGTPQTAINPKGLGFPTTPVRSANACEVEFAWRPRVTRRIDATLAYDDGAGVRAGWSGSIAVTLRADWRRSV